MVRCDQLIPTMIRLSPLDRLLSVVGTSRQLIRPIHPIHTGVNMVLITRTNLEDSGYPVIVRFLPRQS